MFLRLQLFCVLVVGAVGSIACDEASTTKMPESSGETAMVLEVISPGDRPALQLAARDLENAVREITGGEGASTHTVEVLLRSR